MDRAGRPAGERPRRAFLLCEVAVCATRSKSFRFSRTADFNMVRQDVRGGDGLNCIMIVTVLGTVLLQAAAAQHSSPEAARGSKTPHFGEFLFELTDLDQPQGVAAFDGGFVVAEQGANRIRAFSEKGQELWIAQGHISEIGSLAYPEDVAVTVNGEVIVADTGNHRLVWFDANGHYLRTMGVFGDGLGQLHRPRRIAVGVDTIAVVEDGSRRVQLWNHQGQPLASVSAADEIELAWPNGVAVLPDGSLAMTDKVSHRIIHWSPDAGVINRWGEYGSFPGMLSTPAGLSHFGELYSWPIVKTIGSSRLRSLASPSIALAKRRSSRIKGRGDSKLRSMSQWRRMASGW